MDLFIWFNLLLFENKQWFYLDSYDTLEACQEQRQLLEEVKPGLYSCIPRYVEQVDNENNHELYPRSKS